jgi:3'-phosphoadenosine 5'-phosphosulfate sulfotransferase (PAPS reductase)/FAD synthetase
VSGGKDSAALSLWLTEQGIDHDRLFADTGWEHPDTYEYLRGPLAEKLGPITEVRSEVGGMQEWARKKGMFASRLRRWCTEELKVKPIKKHLQAYDCEVVNTVGIRAAESAARAKMPRWEEWAAMDCDVWRPLIQWEEQDVIDIHVRHELAPNPLYLRGSGVERVGCWPCIFSRKREIAQVAELTPWRIDEIRQLEEDVTEAARLRAEKKGEELRAPRSFFHDKGKRMTPIPIDEVAAWARTSHGGRQLLLLDKEPPGCVRWGMCEGHGGVLAAKLNGARS